MNVQFRLYQVSQDLISESNREYVLGQINEILSLLEADPRKVPVINIHSESLQPGANTTAASHHSPSTASEKQQQQQQQSTMENKVLLLKMINGAPITCYTLSNCTACT